MKIQRRKFLQLAAGGGALLARPYVARAQAYPTQPVRIIAEGRDPSATLDAALLGAPGFPSVSADRRVELNLQRWRHRCSLR